MRREVKVRGDVNKFLAWAEQEGLILGNYQRDTKEADKQKKDGKLTFDQWYAKYRTA